MRGTCPACGSELRFAGPPVPGARCAGCGAAWLPLLVEEPAPGADAAAVDPSLELELLALDAAPGEESDAARALASTTALVRVGSGALLAALAAVALLLVAVFLLLGLVGEGRAGPRMLGGLAGLVIVVGTVAVGRVVRANERALPVRSRSMFAVIAGAAVYFGGYLLLNTVAASLEPSSWSRAVRLGFVIAFFGATSAAAGFAAARYAPKAPIAHAVSVVVVLTAIGWLAGRGALLALLFLPATLAGAWAARRSSRAVAAAG